MYERKPEGKADGKVDKKGNSIKLYLHPDHSLSRLILERTVVCNVALNTACKVVIFAHQRICTEEFSDI